MKKSFLAIALSSSFIFGSVNAYAQAPTFGELQTIRILAGQTIGQTLQTGLGLTDLGILSNRSGICSTLVGGIGAGFVSAKGDAGLTFESIVDEKAIGAAVDRVASKPAVYLAFSGEKPREENIVLLEKTLEDMADKKYTGTVIFHATTWGQKQPADIVKGNAKVAAYLSKTPMNTITLDLPNKQAVLQKVTLNGTEFKLEELGRVTMRDDLVELFKRAAAPKK
ncbi:MAG: hypothetical protein JXR44_07565 [Thiotrichales bacterium]|nr:hypothetical protein [Thiotrichales bacterium]